MPNINAGNTNAPAMMLGSRCAEFIIGGAPRSATTPGSKSQEGVP
jgi:choline dehydrogenase